MGIKHLTRIEDFLKSSSLVPITTIRDSLQIDLNTLKESLDYLIDKNVVELVYQNNKIKYKLK